MGKGGCPYNSGGQFGGRSILCPSRSSENSSSTGMPGYGEPPRVKISHSRIPKDHLEAELGLSRARLPSSWRLWQGSCSHDPPLGIGRGAHFFWSLVPHKPQS